jgi:hypothetical protein
MSGKEKRVVMEIARAYDLPELESLRRTITLSGDEAVIEDRISFSESEQIVEEAFVVWTDPVIDGSVARVSGERHNVELTIEEPVGATWSVEAFEEESKANNKKRILKRLTFTTSGRACLARVRIRTGS